MMAAPAPVAAAAPAPAGPLPAYGSDLVRPPSPRPRAAGHPFSAVGPVSTDKRITDIDRAGFGAGTSFGGWHAWCESADHGGASTRGANPGARRRPALEPKAP